MARAGLMLVASFAEVPEMVFEMVSKMVLWYSREAELCCWLAAPAWLTPTHSLLPACADWQCALLNPSTTLPRQELLLCSLGRHSSDRAGSGWTNPNGVELLGHKYKYSDRYIHKYLPCKQKINNVKQALYLIPDIHAALHMLTRTTKRHFKRSRLIIKNLVGGGNRTPDRCYNDNMTIMPLAQTGCSN